MLAVVIPLLGAVGYAIYKFGRLENTVEFVQHQIENIATTSRELADEAVRTRSKLESIDTTLRRLNQDPESKSGTRKR
jgi:prefoldin subunit 5